MRVTSGVCLFHICLLRMIQLFFCQASVKEIRGVLEVLDCYANGSRQLINREKSSLFFGANCNARQRKKIGRCINIQDREGIRKYLGLLADFGHFKCAVFEEVRKGMDARFNGWAEQYLSQAGKEVLIKAVTMAMPNYAMSCFKLLVRPRAH